MSTRNSSKDQSTEPPDGKSGVDLAQRLAFLELTNADAGRLRSMGPLFELSADEFVKAFYNYLLAFDETAKYLRDSERVRRLEKLQREHLDSLLEADWGNEFVARRQRVGKVHAEVGLEPHLFLGAYNQYAQHCLRRIAEEHGREAESLTEPISSLIKAIFLDIGLTLDAYFEQTTDELRRALDLYWKANSDLRRFAQLASHDLKTPIATMANLCDEALDEFGETMPAEAQKLITSAREQAFKNSAIIDDLLESALSLQGENEREEVSSEEIIHDVLDRLQSEIRAKNINVTVPDALPTVWGNKARLREAFYNLLSNASKFIEKSPGRINIKVEQEGSRCIFSIEDNGPGIPEGDLQRIFVPFRRLAKHHGKPGSGLGLYFTMHLVERDGGQVWAESTSDEGSRFCVALQRPK